MCTINEWIWDENQVDQEVSGQASAALKLQKELESKTNGSHVTQADISSALVVASSRVSPGFEYLKYKLDGHTLARLSKED